MAEGPFVHYCAAQLAEVLEGHGVRVEFRVPDLEDAELSFQGLRIARAEAYGEQTRIHFSDGRIVLVHLSSQGLWHTYHADADWEEPADEARVVLRTPGHEAVAFSASAVVVLTEEELRQHPTWGNQGPDPLRSDFSEEEFLRRLNARPDQEIGEALIDQHVVAGVGDLLRSEILFRSRIEPRRRVADLTDQQRAEMLRWLVELSELWLEEMDGPGDWICVHHKGGEPCPHCGTEIEHARLAGRDIYVCRSCQRP